MLQRTLQKRVSDHLSGSPFRPLLLLGAAGTGKATMVENAAGLFDKLVRIDLTDPTDRKLFQPLQPFDQTLKILLSKVGEVDESSRICLFLKEVMDSPPAAEWCQQAAIRKSGIMLVATTSFYPGPAGVSDFPAETERILVPPLTFDEFLTGLGDRDALDAFREVPVPYSAYKTLLTYFHLYSLVGGMPEIVDSYLKNRDLSGLSIIYENLLERVIRQVAVHAHTNKTADLVTETLQNSFPFAATRIKFNHFGNSARRSREIANAFRILAGHHQLNLVFPVTSTNHEMNQFKRGSRRKQRLFLIQDQEIYDT